MVCMTACQASQDHPLPLSRADLAFASSARVAIPLSRADLAFASSARVAVPLSPLSRADLAFASSARVAVPLSLGLGKKPGVFYHEVFYR